MRGALIALVLATAACNSLLGIDHFETAPDGGNDDAPPIDADLRCFGTLATVCLPDVPTGAVEVMNNIDTTAGTECTIATDTAGKQVCVIAGGTVTVDKPVTVVGTRPLVVLAATTLSIGGSLDASSVRGTGGRTGAAANDASCTSTDGTDNLNGGGGGAGGSFGSSGGAGGNGDPTATGGTAGAVDAVPTRLRGGCPGTFGGDGDKPNSGGDAGASGGAIYLVARTEIAIAMTGTVFASGAGGGAGDNNAANRAAGGGGGSGGMIALEAPAITVDGIIAANGGGGGGGGDCCNGLPGAEGTTLAYDTFAVGGSAEDPGVHGGSGGAGGGLGQAGAAGQTAAQDKGGGGGGGGGGGVIWTLGTLAGTQRISPVPVQP